MFRETAFFNFPLSLHFSLLVAPAAESFAPIEQYQTRGNFGAWTDVYALAATLYTLVTKEVPFPSRFRTHAELPSPKQHNSELSDRINEAILKGMELEYQNRPRTMEEWLELLTPSFTSSSKVASSVGVDDYIQLRDFLATGKWKEAEQETARIMLKVANREEKKYLDYEDIKNFPCEHLSVIDLLWTVHSKGKFGFSIQQKIWQELGSQIDWETELKLQERVGWHMGKGSHYLRYDLNAPEGHLPGMFVFKQYWLDDFDFWDDKKGCLCLDVILKPQWWSCALASRFKYCNSDTITLPFDIDLLIKPLDYAIFYCDRAKEKIDNEDVEGAIEDYNQAICLNPEFADAYYSRGSTRYIYLKDCHGAIEDYTQLIRLQPDNDHAYYLRGIAREKLKEYQGATEDYTQLIRLQPNRDQGYYFRGDAYYELKDYQEAIADYTKAIHLKPKNNPCYHNRGLARYELKDYQGAI